MRPLAHTTTRQIPNTEGQEMLLLKAPASLPMLTSSGLPHCGTYVPWASHVGGGARPIPTRLRCN